MDNLIVNLDLSRTFVINGIYLLATIVADQVPGKVWRRLDLPPEGVSYGLWTDFQVWASQDLHFLLQDQKFVEIVVRETTGLRGYRVYDSWLGVAKGMVMSLLYDGYVLRDKEGKPLVANPVKTESESIRFLA